MRFQRYAMLLLPTPQDVGANVALAANYPPMLFIKQLHILDQLMFC